jgi:serine/threonine protein kinase
VTDVQGGHPSLEHLVAFRLGRLPEAEGAVVQTHLDDCPTCRALADAMHPETLSALLQPSSATPPPGIPPARAAAAELATITPPPVAPSQTAIPAELVDHPRYRVRELLGTGGMGCVYKAEHRLMERAVALKVVNSQFTGDPAAIERFEREVRTAARLSHPNIVTAHDAEQAKGLHFLVMEYVEGASLDRWVEKRGPLPVAEACDYIRQAAQGLQHAHERGMVHRDIKPQNLMRDPAGRIKILDFGLARFISESKPITALTQVGSVMGTPDFIAPEQAHDARAADIRSDVYSLGCTLYYLLTAHVPFPGGSILQKLMAHVERTPPRLTDVRSDAPPELAHIVERMMAKDPAARFATPGEVAWVLTPFAEGHDGLGATASLAAAPPPASGRPSPPPLRPESPATDAFGHLPRLRPVDETIAGPPVWRPRSTVARNLGMASFFLGLLALPFSFIPCVGLITLPFSVIGGLLGGAGLFTALFQNDRRVGFPVAGLVVNGLAFLATFLWFFHWWR